jgi:hypothetical protein
MRSEPNKLQYGRIGFLVNQNKIGPKMAVPMIFPTPHQSMVVKALRQRFIVRQYPHYVHEMIRQKNPVWAFRLAFQIAFKGRGLPNFPHPAPLADRRV